MKKKVISALLCGTMVVGLMTGCGSSSSSSSSDAGSTASSEGETITFMAPDWAIPSDDMLDAFTEDTGINVEVSVVGWDDIREKLATAATGNQSVADVVEVDWSWVGEFYDAGWLETIEMSDEDQADFLTLDTFKVGDDILAVPYANDYRIGFYNKAQYEEAGIKEEPQTYADMLENAKAIKEAGICDYPIAMSLNAEEKASTGLMWTAFMMDGVVWNEDGTFNEEAIMDALNFIQDALDADLIAPEDVTASGMEAYNRIPAGTASLLVGPTFLIGSTQDPEQSAVVDQVKAIICPGKDAKAEVTMALPEGLGILSSSEHKEAAKTFIDWYTSADMQKEMQAYLGNLPTRNSVLQALVEDGTIEDSGAMLEQAELIASPFPNGVPSYYAEMSSAMYNAVNKLGLGELDAKGAYEEMSKALDELINE